MRRLLLLGAMLAAATLGACKFDEVTVPRGKARPVVHAVLDPSQRTIRVLLERTLAGRVNTVEGRYDPDDPVVSTGGEPIVGARVAIVNVTRGTDSGVAQDAAQVIGGGKGRGLYLLENVGCGVLFCPDYGIVLNPGFTYELHIRTQEGEELVAQTTIPNVGPKPDTGLLVTFDASGKETYTFRWNAAEGFGRYAVQVQTPFGPFQVFSDVESLAVNGTLRNFQQERFPRTIVPGFRQYLTAMAVDRAYLDYYRTANDPFTGSGLLSNVQGGSGVFGSVRTIRTQFLNVVGPFDDPQDGRFQLVGGGSGAPTLTIYVDGAFVSGRRDDPFDPQSISSRGMLGVKRASGIELQVLGGMSARDTAWTYALEYRGDTLVTTATFRPDSAGVTRPSLVEKWRRVP